MDEAAVLDAFHGHEVLHTAAIVAELFEARIEQHCFTQADAELRHLAAQISGSLHEFYQMVGRITLP